MVCSGCRGGGNDGDSDGRTISSSNSGNSSTRGGGGSSSARRFLQCKLVEPNALHNVLIHHKCTNMHIWDMLVGWQSSHLVNRLPSF